MAVPFLNELLGLGGAISGGGGADRGGLPQTPSSPEDEIIARGDEFPKPYRGLIKKGTFSLGGTGANILGTIGDAILIGSGHDPIYQKRMQDKDTADALIDFNDNRGRSLAMLSQVPGMGEKAAELSLNNDELSSQSAYRAAQQQKLIQEQTDRLHSRAAAYLGAATPKTYAAIKPLYEKLYADAGVEPPFDLPDQYDEETLRSIAAGEIPMKDQATLEESRRYHDASLINDRREEFGRNFRDIFGKTMDSIRAAKGDQADYDRSENVEKHKDNRAKAAGKGGRPDGITWERDANGNLHIVKKKK